MFTLARVQPLVSSSKKKMAKKFKKFGQRMFRERQLDLERYGQRLKDIAVEERKRSQQLLQDHREFFEKNFGSIDDENIPTSIDFFEK